MSFQPRCLCRAPARSAGRLLLALLVTALSGAVAGAGESPFPVEIEHRYGTATISEQPRRVVSLSFNGHDFLLALGVVPVALRHWYGDKPHGVWDWAQAALGDAEPLVLEGEINIERIAALRPDLIVGIWSGMSADEYRLLSRIAPTIAPRAEHGDYGTPWQVMTLTLGRALGREARARELVAGIEARFERIAAAHPQWQGRTATVAWAVRPGAYTSRDVRGRLMQALGFEIPAHIDEMAGENAAYLSISQENLPLLDADVLIWLDDGQAIDAIRDLALRPQLRAYREGREIYADPLLGAAMSHSSPLSLPYALDRLVPLIEQAVDGDPATVVHSTAEAGLLPETTPAQ